MGGGSILFTEYEGGKFSLWQADVRVEECEPWGTPETICDRSWIGDQPNAAVFFTERYLPHDPKMPIENIKFLAAHSILQASFLNTAGISGLEIVLCRNDGSITRVPRDEISELTIASQKLDGEIKRRLLHAI